MHRPWLHRFAIVFVVAVFILIALGGTVTSKGAGLAVPDWPTTFDHHMFLFPPSLWVGNIFWEHVHRLMGSLVGLMAIVMAVWLWQTQSRAWVRNLGLAALGMIIVQGIMGGLRVTQLSTGLAVVHGITAQIIICITVLISAATSRWWIDVRERETGDRRQGATDKSQSRETASLPPVPCFLSTFFGLHRAAIIALIALFIQLALGSIVRHHGAGLAIPDFPLAYGNIIPPLTQTEIESAMTAYADKPDEYATTEHGWYTPFQVAIHWTHRLWAIVAVGAVAHLIAKVLRRSTDCKLKTPSLALGLMIVLQVALGASIIWTGRHPEIATSHQTLGAIVLATTALIWFRIRRLASAEASPVLATTPARAFSSSFAASLPEGAGA